MDIYNDYTFTTSVSKRSYRDKEQAHAGCKTMKFQQMELTPDVFLSLAGAGYAFCYNYRDNHRCEANFLNTQIIIFDIDYPTTDMDTYIQGLPYKPTMGYTSYSNNPGENYYRFRLIYGFDSPITREQDFYSLYYGISTANGFGKSLDKRKISQLYFGSNARLDSFQDYNSNFVYSFNDFQGYIQESSISPSTDSHNTPTHIYSDEKDDTITDEERHNYFKNYLLSFETELVKAPSHTHFTYPENYYRVPVRIITQDGKRVIKRWKDGERRRQKLYISALIMLKNLDTLTPDNLSFNLWQLIGYYYDNRKDKITKDDIDGIVERAFDNRYTYDLQPTEHKGIFRINKEYWAALGITPQQAVPMVMKERNMSIMDYYNPSLSVSANYDAFLEMGLDVRYSTLCKYVKDLGLKRDLDSEILELLRQAPEITIKDVATALGKSTSTISRHIKIMQEEENPRVRKEKEQINRIEYKMYEEMV